jgi:hypothetical protein
LSFKYSLFLFLKYLLASRLTLLILSSFSTLGSCNHCSLAASFDQPILLYNDRPIHSLAEIFIFSLIASHALLMSPLSSKFSRAENMFFYVTWYCSLTSASFYLLRLNLSISILFTGRLLTASLSLILQLPNSGQYHNQPL